MKNVHVSVIIPSYNMGNLLPNAIESVLSGDLQEVEIIIVDDGSTDDTENIVNCYINQSHEKYDYRVKYIYQRNNGKSDALNHGLRLVRGEYFAILDADDELPPDGLENRWLKAKQSEGYVDCVIGGFSVIDEQGNSIGRRSAPETKDPSKLRDKYFFGYKTPFHLCACLLHRDLVDRVGFFNPLITRVDDLDYALRVLKAVRQIELVHKPVYSYRKYRSEIRERLHYRWATLLQRPQVYWRHAEPIQAPLAVSAGLISDLGKGMYEIFFGNYDR
jgi:glycosyltransferase involved in cell wall biosynthesis